MKELSEQSTLKNVRRTLNALPAGLFAAFENAMKRIEDQHEMNRQLARRALSYIFCAKRPLHITELCHALAVEADNTELDTTSFLKTEMLLKISAGLIKIDEKSGTARLVHYTLQ